MAIEVALDLGIDVKTIKKTVPKIHEGVFNLLKVSSQKTQKHKVIVDGCHSDESTKNLALFIKFKIPIYGIWEI